MGRDGLELKRNSPHTSPKRGWYACVLSFELSFDDIKVLLSPHTEVRGELEDPCTYPASCGRAGEGLVGGDVLDR